MLDLLIQIPEPMFLIYFNLFSMSCIVMGWLRINFDGSTQYQLPELTTLTPFEMAALQPDERTRIIHIALSNLWHRQLITTSGEGREIQIESSSSEPPSNKIEKLIFNFINQQARTPAEFFENTTLLSQLDEAIEPLHQKLEQQHLEKTSKQLQRDKIVLLMILFLIWANGGSKLLLSLYRGMPINFLIILLIFMTIITFVVLIPQRTTRLGQQYLQKLIRRYNSPVIQKNLDIDWQIAILGMVGIASHPVFSRSFPTTLVGMLSFDESKKSNRMKRWGVCGGGGGGGGCGGGGGGGCGGGGGGVGG